MLSEVERIKRAEAAFDDAWADAIEFTTLELAPADQTLRALDETRRPMDIMERHVRRVVE